MKRKIVKFRLTKGRKPTSFQIPTKQVMLPKGNEANAPLKKIQYIPGHDSIFKEDHKGDEDPVQIFFEEGLLNVDLKNTALITLLKRHPWYNLHYELVDDEASAVKELDKFDLIEKALDKVNIAQEDELKANAIVLIGSHVIDYTEKRLRASLKKMAFDTPEKLIETMNKGNYSNRLAAALAVLREVVFINPTRTAIIWPDGKPIINIASGQDPITEFGTFLSQNTEEIKVTLQTIGQHIKAKRTPKTDVDVDNIIPPTNPPTDPPQGDSEIIEAREAYKTKFQKEVPINMKNNLEWINSQLKKELEPA